MAATDIFNSIKGFIATTTKTNGEFKSETAKNNRNMSSALRDISRMFSSQKSDAQETRNSVAEVLDATNQNARKIDQNTALLKQSISVQNQMLDELKKISSGLGSLTGQSTDGGLSFGGKLAATALATTAIAPGMLNNLFKDQLGNSIPSNSGFSDTGGNGQTLKVAEMVKIAKEAGFNDNEAAVMGAIGAAESSGNTRAFNGQGRDKSYGLWQINMLGDMGPARRAQFGIQNDEELFDPKINAKAAYTLYKQRGNFDDWSAYKNGSYLKYMGTAQKTLQEGDVLPNGQLVTSPTKAPINGFAPQSSPTGAGGAVKEEQAQLAGIRKLPLSDALRNVLKQAASAAGVDVVVYSGGQPSKSSGQGPRTGSTRHDDGNAADLWLEKDGRKLTDETPEDREIMAKFVSAAASAGATGIGAGHDYMGPSSIHVGFGTPATWGGAPWVASAASGVYSNKDLQAEASGKSGAGGYGPLAAGSMGALGQALSVLGMPNVNIPNLVSSFFGLGMPMLGMGGQQNQGGSIIEEESKEGEDTSFPGRSRGVGGATADQIKSSSRKEKDFINIEKQTSIADQLKQIAMVQPNPIIINQHSAPQPQASQEAMTDFGNAGNEPRNTRASWAPRVAVLRPDDNAVSSLRWAARISPTYT